MNPQELFLKAQHITISLPPSPSKEEFESACLFFAAAKKMGKEASLQGMSLKSSLPRVATEGKTFAVSLRGLSDLISKIHYEKSGRDVKLYFTLRNGEMSSSNIALETSQPSNLILIVGNNRARNNSLEEESSSAIQGTKEFLFETLSLLPAFDLPTAKLSARILTRLREHKRDLYATHLVRQDFIETQTTQRHLLSSAAEIKEYGEKSSSYLILFDTIKETKGILWSPDINLQKRILSQGKGTSKNNWTMCSFPQNSAKAALKEITRAL